MGKKRNTGDTHLCLKTADCLLLIGQECNELDKEGQSKYILFENEAYWAIPAIINLSFACELYLKRLALIYNCEKGGALHTHDLGKLFDDLPKELQKQAEDKFAQKTPYKTTLSDTLLIHANSFDNWRYIYEPQNQNSEAYIENLLLAAKVLQDISNNDKVDKK